MDKRKMKARRTSRDDHNKPTKEEYAVAKCLKFNAPSKEGKFEGNNVHYFMGSKVVDFLMESQWSAKKSKTNPLFSTRPTCAAYCSRLLSKGFFCRVEKQERKKKEIESRNAKDEGGTLVKRGKTKKDLGKNRKAEEEGDCLKPGEQSGEEKTQDQTKDDSSNEDSNKKKKKKLPRLNYHSDQKFMDGLDLYVWLYDPVPITTFIIGLLLVVGAIALCLFPLWPPEIKLGIYYLSCAAFGFIGVILSLCVVRLIVFVLVWLFSMGEVSLWLLPNLTEDVGFFESFKPLYKINHSSQGKDEKLKPVRGDEEPADNQAEEAGKTEGEEEEEEDDEDDEGQKGHVLNAEDDVKNRDSAAVGTGDDDDDVEAAAAAEVGYDDDEEEEDGNESYEVIDAEDDEDDENDDDDDDVPVDDDDGDDDGSSKEVAAAGDVTDVPVADKKND